MQILSFLGMYFDAVVVEVEKSLLFQIGSAILCAGTAKKQLKPIFLMRGFD